MSPRCVTLVAICVLFISTEAVLGEDVKKSVGDEVSFRPDKVDPPIHRITWKHKHSIGLVVKVIEWDAEDGVSIMNQRFKDITTLDEKTGQLTITNVNIEHSGIYIIEINSKEQEQRFKLTVTDEEVKNVFGEVGGTVSFRPARIDPPVTSIIWKHRNSGIVVKVIEWDAEDGVFMMNQRFKDITTLDEKTGQITITNVNIEHSGLYTIEINSKEQKQRFNLTVTDEEVKNVFGEVGGTVSFRPARIDPPVTSIIWKHRNSGIVVKVIEWDAEDGVFMMNQRFKDITTLDEKTGQITITNVNIEHSGLYTIEINSKEQEQRFKLTVTDEEVKNVFGEVGGTVSFRPAGIDPPVTSIIWKHRNSGIVVKVIEWDAEDGVFMMNQRFKDITTLDEKTGQITITNVNIEHSGLYTIDINSKEQEQRFKLKVLAPVPKPEIKK